MKMAYVTTYDASDVKQWSGLGYYIDKSLQDQGIDVLHIGSLQERLSLLFKAKQYTYQHLLNKRYLRQRSPVILKGYAEQVRRQLSTRDVDVVFSPSTLPVAYLQCKQPIVTWTDATFGGMIDFYPWATHLCQETVDNGNVAEQAALERCSLALYSSEWAATSAIKFYHVEPSKVHVVPFGANIEFHNHADDIKQIIADRPSDRCKLLFLGVEWLRKGGDIALEVAKELNRGGLKTDLTIVGCQPLTDRPLPNFVHALGFISKATPEGLRQINQLLAEAHFLIMPSRAECYGLVLCEANAYGVPCLATRVGGIPTIIEDDVNGKLFSLDASISEYCDYISALFVDYKSYRNLALSSFNEYLQRLNWSVAAQTVKNLMLSVL